MYSGAHNKETFFWYDVGWVISMLLKRMNRSNPSGGHALIFGEMAEGDPQFLGTRAFLIKSGAHFPTVPFRFVVLFEAGRFSLSGAFQQSEI